MSREERAERNLHDTLWVLLNRGELGTDELARVTGMSEPHCSRPSKLLRRALRYAEDRGLVRRRNGKQNRYSVSLTPHGLKYLKRGGSIPPEIGEDGVVVREEAAQCDPNGIGWCANCRELAVEERTGKCPRCGEGLARGHEFVGRYESEE